MESMHDAGEAAAVVEVSGIAKIFVGRNEFARIVLDVEMFAQPCPRGGDSRMFRRQSAVEQRDNSIDGGASIGIEPRTIAIAAGRAGFVANRLGRRKKEAPIVEFFIPLISLGRQVLASLDEQQRGRDGRVLVGNSRRAQRLHGGGGGGEIGPIPRPAIFQVRRAARWVDRIAPAAIFGIPELPAEVFGELMLAQIIKPRGANFRFIRENANNVGRGVNRIDQIFSADSAKKLPGIFQRAGDFEPGRRKLIQHDRHVRRQGWAILEESVGLGSP